MCLNGFDCDISCEGMPEICSTTVELCAACATECPSTSDCDACAKGCPAPTDEFVPLLRHEFVRAACAATSTPPARQGYCDCADSCYAKEMCFAPQDAW
jgi:hypothetical protein